MKKQFTETYDDVLAFIVEYKRTHDGNSPTMREIQDGCGISSTSVVNYALARLEALGRIKRDGGWARRQITVIGGRWEWAG